MQRPNIQLHGSLNQARAYETATVLPSGQVLVVGGQNSNGSAISTSELYTPSSGTFSFTASLQHGRSNHTATYLPSINKVLITGGWDSNHNSLSTAELYDVNTGTFSGTGSMGQARAFHSATLIKRGIQGGPIGFVLIAGGQIGSTETSSTELYNPATGQFSPAANMSSPRSGHTATLLTNGETILIAGGISGKVVLNTAEEYDSEGNQFIGTIHMPAGVVSHTATLLQTDEVLISGGDTYAGTRYVASNSNQIYEPNGLFGLGGNLQDARFGHSSTLLNNGQVLIAVASLVQTRCTIQLNFSL